jgi:hypothetical protein
MEWKFELGDCRISFHHRALVREKNEGIWGVISWTENFLKYNAIFFFTEHLDFMNTVDTSEVTFQQFRQMEHEYIGYQSLTDVPRALQYTEDPKTYHVCAIL